MTREHSPITSATAAIYRTIPGRYALAVTTVAGNLRALRAAEGLTQEEIGERGKLKQSAVSKYERGRAKPDLKSLLQLAVGLGYDVNALLAGVYPDYDLLCQGPDLKRLPREKEVADVPASARRTIADLERRLAESEAIISQVRDVISRLATVVVSDESREIAAQKAKGRRIDREAS